MDGKILFNNAAGSLRARANSFGTRVFALMLLVAYIVAACLCWSESAAASRPYVFRASTPLADPHRISRFPELEGRGVRCLAEDHQGAIWFGLDQGVVRYDGLDWQEHGEAQGLGGDAVEAIVIRADGQVVAATAAGLFEHRNGQWHAASPRMPLTHVVESSDGALWACSPIGLLKLHDGEKILLTSLDGAQNLSSPEQFTQIRILPDSYYPSPPNLFSATISNQPVATENDHDAFHAATEPTGQTPLAGDASTSIAAENSASPAESGLTLPTAVGDQTFRRRRAGQLQHVATHSFFEDSQGRFWVGTFAGQVLRSDDGGERWRSLDRRRSFGKRPNTIELDNGEIWVVSSGTKGGVQTFDGIEWHRQQLAMLTGSNYASAACQTVDGTVWVGGLNRLHLFRFGEWHEYDTRELDIPSDSHRFCVTEDHALWIAGYRQSVVRIAMSPDEFWSDDRAQFACTEPSGIEWFIDKETKEIIRKDERAAIAFGRSDGVIDDPIGVAMAGDGKVVAFGSHGKVAALCVFDGAEWDTKTFPKLARRFSRQGYGTASDGTLWLGAMGTREPGQTGGIVIGGNGGWRHVEPPNAPRHATSIVELRAGQMLLCGAFGVGVHDGKTWHPSAEPLLQCGCPDSTLDATGSVWVATRASGLARRCQNGAWQAFGRDHGLRSIEPFRVAADRKGSVWASTAAGLMRLDGQEFKPVALPRQWGRSSITVDPVGRLWFDRRRRYTPDQDAPVVKFADRGPIRLEPKSVVAVSWHGVDPWNRTPASRLAWSYQLDNGPWSPYRRDDHAILRDLPPGRHTLRIRARDDDWNVSNVPAPLLIRVLPPVWMRPWFLTISSALVLGLVWQAVGLVRRDQALRRVNAELKVRAAELADSNNELASFAHTVSHDLRSPLHVIGCYTSLLLKDDQQLVENGAEFTRQIASAADQMQQLIDDLLAYSKLSRSSMEFEDLSLASVLADAESQQALFIQQKQATIEIANTPEIVRANRRALVQALSNLLGNAIKYHRPDVPPIVHISSEKIDGRMVRIVVADNGIGVPADNREEIFEPFRRLHGQGAYPGTGIGLAIVKRVASRHGCRCGVEATPAGGSRFWIEIPAAGPSDHAAR